MYKDNNSMEYRKNYDLKGEKKGNQKIIVSSPKSNYKSEILVLVNKTEENPRFITSDKNVIMLEVGAQFKHIQVRLYSGEIADNRNFIY